MSGNKRHSGCTFQCVTAVCTLFLAGCAADVRQSSAQRVASRDYEGGLANYLTATTASPDDLDIRSGLLTTKEVVASRLLNEAKAFRAHGDFDDAQMSVQRLLVIDPNNSQAQRIVLELGRDRRSKAAAQDARERLGRGQLESAAVIVSAALKDDPSDPALRALQTQLEAKASEARDSSSIHLAENRPISIDFRDASLRLVLEALTRSAGINFIVDKDIRPDLRTTIFLRNAKLEDALDLLTSTNQLGKKTLDAQTILIYPNTPEKAKEYQDLIIRAFYLSSADPKQVAAMLKSMLRTRDAYVDERLSLVVLRDTPENIQLAERLIGILDVSEPEVMMEVEVLELSSSKVTELGIKYPDNITFTPLGPGGTTAAATLADLSGLNRSRIGLNTPTVTINLRREVDDANVLANPRIRARNREKAKILIGDKLPVITSTATSTGFVSESVQYIDVGLKLEVEPNVYLDDEVAIKVALEVSSLKGTITTRGGSTAYQIGTRSANTVLRLRDGETQILAGLISRQGSTNSARVPGLGDIPFLGRLFSSQLDNNAKSELVLSITPHIIRNIRRPELYEAEFWSGTDNAARSRPLRFPNTPNGTNPPATTLPPNSGVSLGVIPPVGASGSMPAIGDSRLQLAGNKALQVGEEITLAVDLTSEKGVRGMPIQISYDKSRLQLIKVDEGPYFKQGGEATTFAQMINAEGGSVQLGDIRASATGAQGNGVIASLQFKALAAGDARIWITSANPIAAGVPINLMIADPIFIKITAP